MYVSDEPVSGKAQATWGDSFRTQLHLAVNRNSAYVCTHFLFLAEVSCNPDTLRSSLRTSSARRWLAWRSESFACGLQRLRRQPRTNGMQGSRTKTVCFFAQDGLEDPHQWLRQLIVQIIPGVNRNVMLQDVKGVFGLFVRSSPLLVSRNNVEDHRQNTPLMPLMIT